MMCLDWRGSPLVTVCRTLACLAWTCQFSLPKHLSARCLLASHAVQCRQSEMYDYLASRVWFPFSLLDPSRCKP
jgi:hypothetical protein